MKWQDSRRQIRVHSLCKFPHADRGSAHSAAETGGRDVKVFAPLLLQRGTTISQGGDRWPGFVQQGTCFWNGGGHEQGWQGAAKLCCTPRPATHLDMLGGELCCPQSFLRFIRQPRLLGQAQDEGSLLMCGCTCCDAVSCSTTWWSVAVQHIVAWGYSQHDA